MSNEQKIKKIIESSYILKKIDEEKVFRVSLYEKDILISENCDCWFAVQLNKKEILELADVFKKIAEKMED